MCKTGATTPPFLKSKLQFAEDLEFRHEEGLVSLHSYGLGCASASFAATLLEGHLEELTLSLNTRHPQGTVSVTCSFGLALFCKGTIRQQS